MSLGAVDRCTASGAAHARALRVFPDGEGRAYERLGPFPDYVERGVGARLHTIDGRRLLDLSNNYGALVHGHAWPPAMAAARAAMDGGFGFTNPTLRELDLGEALEGRIPGLAKLRFAVGGSEAAMYAIRAARALTGRPGIVRIEGAYHGNSDHAEPREGRPREQGVARHPAPISGLPAGLVEDIYLVPFNDLAAAERLFAAQGERMACVMLDPLPSRLGLINATPGYIAGLSRLAQRHGALVIADEVLSLRLDVRGSAVMHGASPDLWIFGKLAGGGLPMGAVGGTEEAMAVFRRDHPCHVPTSGTYAANPLAMAAGAATLAALDEASIVALNARGDRVRATMAAIAAAAQAPLQVLGDGSMFRVEAAEEALTTGRHIRRTPERSRFLAALAAAFDRADIVAPFERVPNLSTAMTDQDADQVLDVFESFVATHGPLIAETAASTRKG